MIPITLITYVIHCAPRYQIGSGATVPTLMTSPILLNHIPDRLGDQLQSLIKLGAINEQNVSLVTKTLMQSEFDIGGIGVEFNAENLAVGLGEEPTLNPGVRLLPNSKHKKMQMILILKEDQSPICTKFCRNS